MVSDLLDDEALIDLRRRAKATDPAAVLSEERQRRASATPGAPTLAAMPASAPAPEPAAEGVCAICRTRRAKDKCTLCGKPTCAADLWIMLRLCRACADERAVERGQRGAKPEAGNWLERR